MPTRTSETPGCSLGVPGFLVLSQVKHCANQLQYVYDFFLSCLMFWGVVSHPFLARGGDVRFYFGLVSMPLLTLYFSTAARVFFRTGKS